MRDWRDRLVVQLWGQAMEIVLAFAREHDVTRWEATRMLVCKGAGVEYVRPRKGRCPNGQRRASVAPKRSNMAPEELHRLRVKLGKRLHGEDYVPLSAEERKRRKREYQSKRYAAKQAAAGKPYEYRPHDAAWHALCDKITVCCSLVPRKPGATERQHRTLVRGIMKRAEDAGVTFEEYFAKMRQRPVYANVDDLAARLPEKLRTKNRIRKLRSLVENGMGREEALAACSVDRRGQHMTSVWAARHEAGGMTRAEAIRNAQARSCETRHAAMLARFEAVVPEAFRARYAGREHEVMKRWRKAARKHGMTFEDYVAALMAAKAANPDGNPRVAENLTPARLAALEAGNEKRLAMAREREESRRKAREEAERERAAKRALVEMLPEGMRTAARKRELLRRVLEEGQDAEAAVATILANGAVRKNAATHPWHRAVKPVAVARKEELKKKPTAEALAKQPAPAQSTTTSRFRNCATCAHGGLFKCSVWPALRASANLVCAHYANDQARPSARELVEFDELF